MGFEDYDFEKFENFGSNLENTLRPIATCCNDIRRAYHVEYNGTKYLDITEFFLEGFYNGEYATQLSKRKLDKWGGNNEDFEE